MEIVVVDGYTLNPGDNPWDALARLGNMTVYDRTDNQDLFDRIQNADIVLTNKTPLRRDMLKTLPQLKYIGVLATGYDVVDIDAAAEKGILVSNIPVYGTETVAQYVFALLLELVRQPGVHDRAVKQGEWAASPDWCFWKKPLFELAEKTIGIVGFGRIGRRIGEIAHAFRMNVIAYDTYHGEIPDYTPFAWADIDDLFAQADFVSLNCNQTPENEGFIEKDLLSRMKKSAFLVNTSRGGLVNDQDLADALNNETIAGAALDVVSVEPIRPDNPLIDAKNIILTPHIAWAALEARRRLMRLAVENVESFLSGTPKNIVNKPKVS